MVTDVAWMYSIRCLVGARGTTWCDVVSNIQFKPYIETYLSIEKNPNTIRIYSLVTRFPDFTLRILTRPQGFRLLIQDNGKHYHQTWTTPRSAVEPGGDHTGVCDTKFEWMTEIQLSVGVTLHPDLDWIWYENKVKSTLDQRIKPHESTLKLNASFLILCLILYTLERAQCWIMV